MRRGMSWEGGVVGGWGKRQGVVSGCGGGRAGRRMRFKDREGTSNWVAQELIILSLCKFPLTIALKTSREVVYLT